MLIVLASAKIMHDVLKTAPDVELSAPRFAHDPALGDNDYPHFIIQ